MATTLADAQEVRGRINAIRQALDDFDKAVDFTAHAQSDKNSLTAEVDQLKKERDSLNAEVQKTKDRDKAARQSAEKRAADADKAHAEKMEDLQRQIQAVEQRLVDVKFEHETRVAEMEKTYGTMLADKRKELADAEERLAAIKELIESHKARAASL